jgi:lipopolysaccharide export system permease protein
MAILTFLFLMDYLIEILDLIIGKGLEVQVVIELFIYNIAWMIALTIPMAVLVAVLMAFGRLSQDGEITAMKASGISIFRISIPVLIMGMIIAILHVRFNDRILPEFNYRAKMLESNIRMKRPSLALRPGVFVERVQGYTLYLNEIDPLSSRVEGVTILQHLDFSPPDPPRIIQAEWGMMNFDETGETLNLDLREGTITEIEQGQTRIHEFAKLTTFLVVEGTRLQRTDTGVRGDREMPIADLLARAEARSSRSYENLLQLSDHVQPFLARVVTGEAVELPEGGRGLQQETRVLATHKALLGRLQTATRNVTYFRSQSNRYLVEAHKKYSIPFICVAFVLVGIPLGIMARRGGAIVGFGFALFFFLLYWMCLILGEDLADRTLLNPWLAMWLPNIIVTAMGIFLVYRSVYEQTFIQWQVLARKIPGRLGVRLAERIAAREAGA